ncbi:hypothetical protein D3C75_921940 [compost metagenome]
MGNPPVGFSPFPLQLRAAVQHGPRFPVHNPRLLRLRGPNVDLGHTFAKCHRFVSRYGSQGLRLRVLPAHLPIRLSESPIARILVDPAVYVAEHEYLNVRRLNPFTFKNALGVPEEVHPFEEAHGPNVIEHVRKIFRTRSVDVPQEPFACLLMLDARRNLAGNDIMAVMDHPLF